MQSHKHHRIHTEEDIKRKYGDNCIMIITDDISEDFIVMRALTKPSSHELDTIKLFVYNPKTKQESELNKIPSYLQLEWSIDETSPESKTSSTYVVKISCLPDDPLSLKIKQKKTEIHYKLRGNLAVPDDAPVELVDRLPSENVKISCVLNQLVQHGSGLNTTLIVHGQYHVDEHTRYAIHEDITSKVQINYLAEAMHWLTN
jgi:hypothetical protein